MNLEKQSFAELSETEPQAKVEVSEANFPVKD